MLAPLAVEHGEDDAPLELAHDLLADLVLATGVRLVRVGLEGLDQLVAVDVGPTAGLLLEHVQVEATGQSCLSSVQRPSRSHSSAKPWVAPVTNR